MPFQSTVRFDQAFGVPGETLLDGPYRAEPGVIRSADPTMNVFGRGFSMDSALPGVWRAGDPLTNAERYGVMTGPKQAVTAGTAAGGALAPTLTVRNEETQQITTMGFVVGVTGNVTALVGNIVRIRRADGVLFTFPPNTAVDPLYADFGATVVRVPQPNIGGLFVMQITQ